MKKVYLILLFFFSLTNYLNAQKTVTSVTTQFGTLSQDNSIQALEFSKLVKYEFQIGNLTHPKFVIQDLYSLFKTTPLYKDSLGQPFFCFYSKYDIDQTVLATYLNSSGFNLIYFDKKYIKEFVDSSGSVYDIKED